MRKAVIVLLALLTVIGQATETPAAQDVYSILRQRFNSAYKAKDYAGMKQAAEDLRAFQHGATNSVYNLACAQALGGDRNEAIRLLTVIANAGQFFEIEKDDDFGSLRNEPRFASTALAMKHNLEPIGSSAAVVTIAEKGLLPEDIAYDPASHSFFVSSVLTRKIVRIDRNRPESQSVFADLSKDPGWPLLAVAIDTKRSLLWVTAAAMPDFAGVPQRDWGKTALIKLDLKTGRELARYLPDDSRPRALGDMTVLPDGGVVVSDGRGGSVYRLPADGKKLEPIDGREFVSPQTPAASNDGSFVFVPDYVRGIARISLKTGRIDWLASTDEAATNGIDGLYLNDRWLYAVQNGTQPERVVRFRLDPSMSHVEKVETLESNTPGLGEPTHGVFIGGAFYFIANSGWNNLDNGGKLRPGVEFSSATIRKILLSHR